MHVWGWYPRKQLEYEWTLNHGIIGSSCPIRNEPGPSETLKYSEYLHSPQYEHHLHNDVWSSSCCLALLNSHLLIKELLSVFLTHGGFFLNKQKCLYLSSFGITDWADQKVSIENVFLLPPPLQSRQDSWGLCFPRHAVVSSGWNDGVLLVKQPCYIRGHKLELDNLVYRGQWER